MGAVRLCSPLSPEECVTRLADATDRERWSRAGSKPAVGRVTTHSVRLRKQLKYHSSFQTFLIGSFHQHEHGTEFRGRVGLHPILIAILIVCFPIGIFNAITPLIPAFRAWLAGGALPGNVFMQLGFVAFLGVLVCVGRWIALGEDRFLIELVATVIEAREVSAGHNSLEASPVGKMP